MHIGLPQSVSKISIPSLFLPSNLPITPTGSARNHSFIFDSSHTFSEQILFLSSACKYHVIYFSGSGTLPTSKQHPLSLLFLCILNSIIGTLSTKTYRKNKYLISSYCKTGTAKTEHMTHVLKSLHWIKIKERNHYNIISLTYELLNTNQHQNLRKLINIKATGFIRSSDHLASYYASLHLLLKYRTIHSTKPLTYTGIIYQNYENFP